MNITEEVIKRGSTLTHQDRSSHEARTQQKHSKENTLHILHNLPQVKLNYQPFWNVFCNDTDIECADKWICSWAIISGWNEITSLGLGAQCEPGLLEQEKIDTRNGKDENNKYGWNKFGKVNITQTAVTVAKYIRTARIKNKKYIEKKQDIILPFFLFPKVTLSNMLQKAMLWAKC